MSFARTLIDIGNGLASARGLERITTEVLAQANAPMLKQMNEHFGLAQKSTFSQAELGAIMQAFGDMAAQTGGNLVDVFASMTEGTAIGEMAEDNARLMIRTIVEAAKSMAPFDPEEQQTILEHLYNADTEETAFVRDLLAADLDPAALAKETGQYSREQIYALSLAVVSHSDFTDSKYLETLAVSLGLDAPTRAALHSRVDIPCP